MKTGLHRDGDADSAAALPGELSKNLGAPYKIDNIDLEIGVSIGLAIAPENGSSMNELIRNGDRALYNAKLSGRKVFNSPGQSSLALAGYETGRNATEEDMPCITEIRGSVLENRLPDPSKVTMAGFSAVDPKDYSVGALFVDKTRT